VSKYVISRWKLRWFVSIRRGFPSSASFGSKSSIHRWNTQSPAGERCGDSNISSQTALASVVFNVKKPLPRALPKVDRTVQLILNLPYPLWNHYHRGRPSYKTNNGYKLCQIIHFLFHHDLIHHDLSLMVVDKKNPA
jgi:hypothetical protein